MSGRCFVFLLAVYAVLFLVLAHIVHSQTNEVNGFHYAIDTVTLRGRIPNPSDATAFLKVSEDVASVLVFVILGFGLSFHVATIEARLTKRQYHEESLRRRGAPEPEGRLLSWQEWLRMYHPDDYERYYGPGKGFKRWLMDMGEP